MGWVSTDQPSGRYLFITAAKAAVLAYAVEPTDWLAKLSTLGVWPSAGAPASAVVVSPAAGAWDCAAVVVVLSEEPHPAKAPDIIIAAIAVAITFFNFIILLPPLGIGI